MENAKEMRDEAVSEYEYDSSPELWDYYGGLYDYKFEKEKSEEGRITKKTTINGYEIDLGGDCFFNFNEKKIKMFKKIDGVEGTPLVDELEELEKKQHHSKENCILLPVTGGLNNVKGRGFDRPDKFLCLIDVFYRNKNLGKEEAVLKSICQRPRIKNCEILVSFMSSFDDVYDFARHFLGIGDAVEDMVGEMLKNGRKDIATADGVEEYIKLACEFWDARKTYEKTRGM